MHWLDITLLIVFALGTILGATRGLVLQVARLLALGVAIYLCVYYHEPIAQWLTPYFLEGASAMVISALTYVLILVGVYAVFFFVTKYLEKVVKVAQLKSTDRALGAGLGLLKAALLSGAVLSALAVYSGPDMKTTLSESVVAPPLLKAMQALFVAVPDHFKEELNAAVNKVQKAAEDRGLPLGPDAFNVDLPDPPVAPGGATKPPSQRPANIR
jgi:membrane protein required for colicin V production